MLQVAGLDPFEVALYSGQVSDGAGRVAEIKRAPAFEGEPVERRSLPERGNRRVEQWQPVGGHMQARHGVKHHPRLAGRERGRERRADLDRVASMNWRRIGRDDGEHSVQ
jgi:hypothetical protein